MKLVKLFLVFILSSFIGISALFAQYEFMHGTRFGHFVFSAPDIVVRWGYLEGVSDAVIVNTGTYSIEHDHGIPFINFYWNDGTTERFLMLINESFMVLYSDNTMPAHVGIRRDLWRGSIVPVPGIRATSTLREGNIVYSATPERLFLHINRVWAVEGGVGEKLYVNFHEYSAGLFISIGYVHFHRPYLFQHNSRPKRIRISWVDYESYVEIELFDTPNFQRIRLPPRSSPEDNPWWWRNNASFKIEILDIFPGTRYNHMCINSIVNIIFP